MCLFCKIAAGEIPAYKVYEDHDHLAFLDINPNTLGHTLVIPKKHISSLLEASDLDNQELLNKAAMIAKLIVSKLDASGVNLSTNSHAIAGQVIDHYHIHILPRFEQYHPFPELDESAKNNLEKTYHRLTNHK